MSRKEQKPNVHLIEHLDKGCKKAKDRGYEGKCLKCPFPACFEDKPVLTRQILPVKQPVDLPVIRSKEYRLKRNQEIKKLITEGKSPKELAVIYGLSPWMVKEICR